MAKKDSIRPEDSAAARGNGSSRSAVADEQEFIVVRCGTGRFAFRLDDVREVIRLPPLVHMPLAPRSLLGLANLRGVVLPVVSLARLLGLPADAASETARVIVTGADAPLGFVVDRVDSLVSLPADRIDTADAGSGSVDAAFLDGVVKGAEGEDSIKILSPARLTHGEFTRGGAAPRGPGSAAALAAPISSTAAVKQELVSFVSFDLHQQEYGLPLERVNEIIPLPAHISEVARAETAVLGVVTLRDKLLPLVSLRALLGLPEDAAREERGKVVVLSMGSGSVGVVADRTRDILHVDPRSIDPAPALLTRGEGDAEITSICRLDSGRRLVALLSPDRLFRSELMRRVISEQDTHGDSATGETDGPAMGDAQFVIFNLGAQEYGLPIEAVREIARPPEQITKLPRAPSFIDGVINLRGLVVPVVDLRRRFELPAGEQAGSQRILVLGIEGGQTGFMVDGVSEVLRVPGAAIRPAPELSSEQMRLISRVANLEEQGRMILLVDPGQLLDQTESRMLAKFERSQSDKASKAS